MKTSCHSLQSSDFVFAGLSPAPLVVFRYPSFFFVRLITRENLASLSSLSAF